MAIKSVNLGSASPAAVVPAVDSKALNDLFRGIANKFLFPQLPSQWADGIFSDRAVANAVKSYLKRYKIDNLPNARDTYDSDPYYGYRFVGTIAALVGGAKDGDNGQYADAYDYLWEIDRTMKSAY